MDLEDFLNEENEFDSDFSSDTNSNSSEVGSEEERVTILRIVVATAASRDSPSGRLVPRVQGFVENVISLYNGEEFRRTFRIGPTAFEYLLELIGPLLSANPDVGRETIRPEKQLLICLYYFATPLAYRCIADLFGVGISTTWRAVYRCVVALYTYRNYFIKWPTIDEAHETERFFYNRNGFPGCIGVCDGSHVEIAKQTPDGEAYINRKKFPSIQFQVVCNHKLEFIHVYAGFPGSVHDMRVFKYSGVQAMCLNNEEQFFPRDTYLLADSAYTNQERLIVPFKDNGYLTVERNHFNQLLSSNRILVECAIGLFKIKWRRFLDFCSISNVELVPFYIVAACVLHNFALKRPEQYEDPVIIPDLNFPNDGPVSPSVEARNLGTIRRNQLKDLLNGNPL